MDSSRTSVVQERDTQRHNHNLNQTITRHSFSTSRRTSSSSSLSSCSSNSTGGFLDDSPLSPATPLGRLLGVPFSWEQLPGIPKMPHSHKQWRTNAGSAIICHKKKDSMKLLPLPPPLNPLSCKTSYHTPGEIKDPRKKSKDNLVSEGFSRDPFLAALVRCSKGIDDEDFDGGYDRIRGRESGSRGGSGKALSRSVNDRFGFVNLYVSCKTSCSVAESIVDLPRSTRASYSLIRRRSG